MCRANDEKRVTVIMPGKNTYVRSQVFWLLLPDSTQQTDTIVREETLRELELVQFIN